MAQLYIFVSADRLLYEICIKIANAEIKRLKQYYLFI